MTEDEVRRIVREEIEKSKPLTHHKGTPLLPNSPIVEGWPMREFPMPRYEFQQPDWRFPGGIPGVTSSASK